MLNGLILECKYLAFKFDKFYDKYLMLSTKILPLGFLWSLLYFIDGFSFVIFNIIEIFFCLLMLIFYIIFYFFFVMIAILICVWLIYIDLSISKELISIIVAIIGIAGVVLTSFQNRKKFIDENKVVAYQELTKIFIDAIRGFTEKKPLETDLALEKYISLSSNKVLSLIVEIKEKSKI